ncbi:hypothetical protein LDO31_00675 [Luteimonas sp. XNQY3]|nr:hypothetical protein [Luteimonas sp. XNQY3]MCD9004765.1 hypothetical protein [Luteimonas sp. XNQY3]
MDYSKLIDFLHTYPAWFRTAIVAWVILSAVVASCFLLVSREAAPAIDSSYSQPAVEEKSRVDVAQDAAPKAAEHQVAPASDIGDDFFKSHSLYASRRDSLDGRFVQMEQFDRAAIGRTVSWEGILHSMEGLTNETTPADIIVYADGDDRTFFGASIPLEEKLFLSSLRRGDKVAVSGSIRFAGRSPYLTAEKIELK